MKRENLNAASYVGGHFHNNISWFFNRGFAGQKVMAQYIQSDDRENVQQRILYQKGGDSELRRDIVFSRDTKVEGVYH